MKYLLIVLFIILFPVFANAQQSYPDSLKQALSIATTDSVRYKLNGNLSSYYRQINRDSAFFYTDQCILLARKNKQILAEAEALTEQGQQYDQERLYGESLDFLLQAFAIVDNTANEKRDWNMTTSKTPEMYRLNIKAYTHQMYAVLMKNTQNNEEAIIHSKIAIKLAEKTNNTVRKLQCLSILGNTYFETNQVDSALQILKAGEQLALQTNYNSSSALLYWNLGQVYVKKENRELALQSFWKGLQIAEESNYQTGLGINYIQLTHLYLSENEKDSALFYALKSYNIIQTSGIIDIVNSRYIDQIYENLSISYQLQNQFDSAYKYQGIALKVKDNLSKQNLTSLANFQKLTLSEQLRLRDIENEKATFRSRIRTYALLVGLALFLLIALILYRNDRQKLKANKVLEKTLNDLKSTQAQLIQSEKMASLGELTAGIAHEIQNPLNFVNNFSEVSSEMIEELDEEIEKGEKEEAKAISADIKENLNKITLHGKRADAIVKGMLEHSKRGSGQKELTNLNALADEFLRLSYQSFLAKEPDFKCELKTDLASDLPQVSVIPQDIGKVLHNLFNNAFYAVNEKAKSTPQPPEGVEGYKPEVTVKTTMTKSPLGDLGVEISVWDNGSGIPDSIKEKIFQPFFTTKPTGSGTGLGLSLSYDIVKAHGGELKVESDKSIGTKFILTLNT